MITTLIFDFAGVLIIPRSMFTTEVNQPLVNWLTQYPSLAAYVFSNSNQHTLANFKAHFSPPFRDVFSARELSLSKRDSTSYLKLAEKVHHQPEQILFIDDQEFNTEAAAQAGLNTIFFTSTENCLQQLAKLVNSHQV